MFEDWFSFVKSFLFSKIKYDALVKQVALWPGFSEIDTLFVVVFIVAEAIQDK